ETGLYYYGARYYNPKTSVFISVDPLAESTMTPYQYTYQNPVRYIDPTGMAAEDPPTKANRNNHNFEVGGKWVDKTGTYTVDRITDEGIEWRSMQKSYSDKDGTAVLISSVTHKTKFRSKLGQWLHDTFTRKDDRGYSWQGNAPQTFLYVYSMNGGNPSVGDRGFFKEGDEIIDINFDEFFAPMNSSSKASNIYEVISQTISTWNNVSGTIDYFEQLGIEKSNNEIIKIQFDSLGGSEYGPIHYRTPFYYIPLKDTASMKKYYKNINDSVRKHFPIKSRL